MADALEVRPNDLSPKGLPWGRSDGELLGRNIFDGTMPLPSAVLLAGAVEHNIAVMARYCEANEVLLAPHGKTTMSPELITRQIDAGAWAITVATAWQAAAVAAMGVPRILLANEVTDSGSLRLLDQLLTARPELELWLYVDAVAALELAEAGVSADVRDRVRVLIELGVDGGRAGVRPSNDALALGRRVAEGPLRLAGVAAFEGLIDGGSTPRTLELVDDLLARCLTLAQSLTESELIGVDEPLFTAGGSAYFDRVVALAGAALASPPLLAAGWRTVLRSGCYVTHDHGTYEQLSPLAGRSGAGDARLLPAVQVIAAVLSVPEAGRAIVGFGRRDASFDAGWPTPLLVRRNGTLVPTGPGWAVTALNDQHAYLDVPDAVRVGDVVVFGISHPCTTFDKWRVLPMVDEEHTVVDVAHTWF